MPLALTLGLRPWAVLKTSGTVFPYTDLPAGELHIFIFGTDEQEMLANKTKTGGKGSQPR